MLDNRNYRMNAKLIYLRQHFIFILVEFKDIFLSPDLTYLIFLYVQEVKYKYIFFLG